MNILPMTPWSRKSQGLNLGAAYNWAMERLPSDDDWAIFRDHDMMTVTRDWVEQFAEAIEFLPDAGAFVGVTNRIDAVWQRATEADPNNHDMLYHVPIAAARRERRTLLDVTDTKGFGGVLFAVSKGAWLAAGGFADGLLCVDHSMHFRLRAVGRRVYVHEGIYCYHLRRAGIGPLPDSTPRVANCPCRGAEQMPTVRVTLPDRGGH